MENRYTPTRMTGDDTLATLREYKSALTELIEQPTATGARAIVLDSPPPGKNLVDCKTLTSTPADCVSTTPRSYPVWMKVNGDTMLQADSRDTVFVRTDSWSCSTGSYPSFVENVAASANGNDLPAAAKAVAPLLAQAFASQQSDTNKE